MKYTVDRIEEGIAVCEDGSGNRINIQAFFLPEGLREGDILVVDEGKFVILTDETAARRKEIYARQNRVFKRHK